jgi:hypothetical protein
VPGAAALEKYALLKLFFHPRRHPTEVLCPRNKGGIEEKREMDQ